MKKLLATLLALSMVVALSACNGTSNPPASPSSSTPNSTSPEPSTPDTPDTPAPSTSDVAGKTVAFIPKLTGNAFFEVANTGAQEYAKDWGITVDYIGSPNATAADQVSVINDAVA